MLKTVGWSGILLTMCCQCIAVSPSLWRAAFALRNRKEGMSMIVTYSDLIQIGILIVGILGLFLQAKKK